MPPRCCRASALPVHCGSSDRLPLVSTTGRFIRRSMRWCSGVLGSMTPSLSMPGATAPATSRPPPRGASRTIGAAALHRTAAASSETSQKALITSRSRAIIANGFRARRLRFRRRATASALVASQASWKPPRPLIARIWPRISRLAAPSTASSVVMASSASARPSLRSSQARGPQAWQAIGCAWKRRSSGARYSAAQAAQRSNARIVVACRS